MKKANPLARILFSVVLLAIVVYLYQQRKVAGPSAASRLPLLTEAPSAEGTDRFAWIPSYPGASISSIHSRVTHGELNYGFDYQTKDDMPQVISFYESRLRTSGFTVQTKPKGAIEIDLHAESPDRKRMLDVVVEKAVEKVVERSVESPAAKAGEKTAENPAGTGVTVAAVQK